MGWVNTLERGVGYTFIDGMANIGQIYVPTFDTGAARNPLYNDFSNVCVGSPILRSYRVNLNNDTIHATITTDPNLTLKNVWRVTALNTLNGLREVIDIPGADLSLLPPGTDLPDMGVDPMLSVVEGLEIFWRRPDTVSQGPMIVEQIRYVGK
jgi:hypothetical protein